MTKRKSLLVLVILVLSTLLWPAALYAEPVGPDDSACLYPSPTERFGVTVFATDSIDHYDVAPLSAGRYLNWKASLHPSQPGGLRFYQMIQVAETGYYPSGEALVEIVRANPGSTWLIGNEADVLWQNNATPEAYARIYHDVYTAIIAVDPTAKFGSNGVGQVSRLRLAWLDRVMASYRSLYGTELPVDVWNIHTYNANEMHRQWGSEIPPGIPNAVGYTNNYGTQWTMATDAGASGGTVHQSRTAYAAAWFAFHGNEGTIYLRTGPSNGIASIYLDPDTPPVVPPVEVDLYAATPGTISRRFSNLVPGGALLGDRHAIRVTVTGRKNPASSGTWIPVDAIRAPSTLNLPNERFEDNDPLRARIITIDEHRDVEKIIEQIRDFRQWMADNGQRNKPLIDTEHGILGTEELGFDYQRVRAFMLDSFNRFVNDLVDPTLGYPNDGNRMLQEWFWFAVAVDDFEGRTSHTGLYNGQTHLIKPLGTDFANFVTPLKRDYRDLEAYTLTLTPSWPLFAGDLSLVNLSAVVRNLGNASAGPFQVAAKLGNGTLITNWPVSGLAKRYEPGHTQTLSYNWQTAVSGNRTVQMIVDEQDQIPEPCGNSNNTRQTQLMPSTFTDLAVSNLTTVPALLPPIPPGTTTSITLKVDLANLGSVGTSAGQISVKFWNGNPAAGGTLIDSRVFTRGNVTLPATATVTWPNRGPGVYDVYVTVDPVTEETNLQNNRQNIRVTIPAGVTYLPFVPNRSRSRVEEMPEAISKPSKDMPTWWLPYGENQSP